MSKGNQAALLSQITAAIDRTRVSPDEAVSPLLRAAVHMAQKAGLDRKALAHELDVALSGVVTMPGASDAAAAVRAALAEGGAS